MREVDPTWGNRQQTGLSSGEGLIWAVGDEGGPDDKCLLAYEPELASTLRVTAGDTNTLSPVLRRAWDGGVLAILNKNSPARASGRTCPSSVT
jgi:hypothetical protein